MRFTKAPAAPARRPRRSSPRRGGGRGGRAWEAAQEEIALLSASGNDLDAESFLGGITTPVFVGSALTNFGVRLLLDAVVDLAPAPSPVPDEEGKPRPLDAPFAGFVFKIQANMDPAHRDRIAFVRVCSGHFQRGMTVTHAPSGKPFATKYASTVFGADRETIEEAFPGDVIGLVNATGLGIGDTLYEADPVRFPKIPSFAPEQFVVARPLDGGRFKQFRRGLAQLDEEGVVQVLRHVDRG
jgi:peptide chain release factor 3